MTAQPNDYFPCLFNPGQIGALRLKNRVMKAPQSTGMSNLDGSVSERLVRHYRDIARGGCGLVIVEYAYVDDLASKSAHCQLGISRNEHIPGLSWLADVIKDSGSRAGIQVEHCGRQKFLGTPPIKSASSIPWPALLARCGDAAIPEPLTIPEIRAIVEDFGNAACRAVQAGFELIEIHGAHGYLITNFLSPHTNKRDDMYGGSLENRMRLLVDVVDDIRSKIGPNFPLTVRLSGTDYEPDGFGIEETIEVGKVLEKHGIDALHISGGDHHQMIHQVSPMAINVGHNVWAAREIKQHVGVPVIASGSITTPELAEDIIKSGKGDYVALGRPLWADPDWVRKAEAGRSEDIRPCIRCNEGCLERTFFRYRAVTCAVNPMIGREGELDIRPALNKKRVLVIGGGPAGMEAARVCALRGHEVTLYEKRRLGGALNEASTPEFKADLRLLKDYFATQVGKLPIKVINKQASTNILSDGSYDVAIVAVGARPIGLKVPGAERAFVYDALDVLNGGARTGGKVIVIGGGMVGTEVALHLAEKGDKVTVVEMLDELMSDCATTDRIVYAERLAVDDVTVLTSQRVEEITETGLRLVDRQGRQQELEADSVVVATGYEPLDFAGKLVMHNGDVDVHCIGDGVRPGKIFDAVHAGFKTGLTI